MRTKPTQIHVNNPNKQQRQQLSVKDKLANTNVKPAKSCTESDTRVCVLKSFVLCFIKIQFKTAIATRRLFRRNAGGGVGGGAEL